MQKKTLLTKPGKSVRSELQRKKISILIGIQCCILFTLIFFLFRRKNNFMGVPKHTFLLERMHDLLDQINEEVDHCLKAHTRKEQNAEFSRIDIIDGLTPLRLSEMTAVFDFEGEIEKYILLNKENKGEPELSPNRIIIKRVILKLENNPEEDKISVLVDNPHIVKTYYAYKCSYRNIFGTDQQLLWLFIEPLNVKVSLKENGKKEEEIRQIMSDTLKGLSYLHSKHIAHLDLKLANVMGHKDKNNNITYKIIDFGFSRQLGENKKEQLYPKRCYGTFPYKSPEVWISSIHGYASDIWCIGAMSLFLANKKSSYFQKRPGSAEPGASTKDYTEFRRFLDGEAQIKIDSETSPELVSFIQACMKKNREERPTAEQLLNHVFIQGKRIPSASAKNIKYYV